jgi:FkbM family methyltransferase
MQPSTSAPVEFGDRLASHLQHLKHQVARRVRIGERQYAMRGYLPFRFGGNWMHEPHMERALGQLLRDRPGAFVDVGANFGQTLALLLAIDAQRRYVGFEPQVACCHYIEQFIRDNALVQMQVLPLALADRNGVAQFHTSHAGDLLGSLQAEHHAEQTGETAAASFVCTRIGDEVLDEIGAGQIALIKIDVEGAEHRVLRGFARAIASQRPVLVFEFLPNFVGPERTMLSPEACRAHRERAGEIEALLDRQRYRLHAIDDSGALQPVARLALDDPGDYVSYNYAALPQQPAPRNAGTTPSGTTSDPA